MSRKLSVESGRKKAPEIGRLNVRAKQCDRCLFGDDPHMPWKGGGEVLTARVRKVGSHFCCHEYKNVMCRGFYERYGHENDYITIAKRLGYVEEVT